ncbi:hypothetical protein [Actinoallomurus rhizosphaericola]|uniref:hypothetical protein n=1 Tax=Actinoallomurus rhizosphaericola TaxID=2952536 RepID=UPI002093C392|nr:hypothetical protein [Actinoallomurus rhizosphaericola]MCO5994940.1 hypothetical protein [Actinoallomurus rhizosphaericola]
MSAQATGAKPKPTHSRTPSKSPTAGSDPTAPGSAPPLPTGTSSGTGNGSDAGVPGTQSLNNPNSPFSLPSLAPNGSGIGFQYPTPDPQIAEPAAKQVRADDASATSPIKWGQSIAAALVLLLLSAHFGMWSRRQRLAAEARAAQAGPAGKPTGGRGPASVRRRRRPPVTELATAETATSGAAETGTPTAAADAPSAAADADKVSPSGADAESAVEEEKPTSGRGGYRGRRRRG